MLGSQSPAWQHILLNLALIQLSFFFLPLSAIFFFTIELVTWSVSAIRLRFQRQTLQAQNGFQRRTILVTGVGMTKGLFFARTFFSQGHDVIGADFEPYYIPVCGRFSSSLKRFYRLQMPATNTAGDTSQDAEAIASKPYADGLLGIVRRENVDMWISCSGVMSAVSDGHARQAIENGSDCICIQFDATTTATLHEKDTFIAATQALGLPVPETYNVTSRDEVHRVLNKSSGTATPAPYDETYGTTSPVSPMSPNGTFSPRHRQKSFIMKTVGVDDKSRGEIMTLLPRPTVSQTYDHIAHINMSPDKKWVLQEFVRGQEYCTHAFVMHGQVKTFVACPSSDMVMHYSVLPPEGALSQAMLGFTQNFASNFHKLDLSRLPLDGDLGTVINDAATTDPSAPLATVATNKARSGPSVRARENPFTGHLSFDFLVDEKPSDHGVELTILPIECNPRVHTAVGLFVGKEKETVAAYMSAFADDTLSAAATASATSMASIDHKIPKTSTLLQNRENGIRARNVPYVSAIQTGSSPVSAQMTADQILLTPFPNNKLYWIGHDIVTLLFQPPLQALLALLKDLAPSAFLQILDIPQPNEQESSQSFSTTTTQKISSFASRYFSALTSFAAHLSWKEGTYTTWDPAPLFWMYHIYWPLRHCVVIWETLIYTWHVNGLRRVAVKSGGVESARDKKIGDDSADRQRYEINVDAADDTSLARGRWSQINVSTGKIFGC